MPGLRTFKSLIKRRKLLSFYIEPSRIKRLKWKAGEKLLLKLGQRGDAYLYRADGIPVTLCRNKANNQWFISFPKDDLLVGDKMKVRLTETNTGIIVNFF